MQAAASVETEHVAQVAAAREAAAVVEERVAKEAAAREAAAVGEAIRVAQRRKVQHWLVERPPSWRKLGHAGTLGRRRTLLA